MKTCTKCDKEKPIEEFHLDRKQIDGHSAKCKPCRLDVNKKWQQVYRSNSRATVNSATGFTAETIAYIDAYLLLQKDLGDVVDRKMAARATKELGVPINAQFVQRCRLKQNPKIKSSHRTANNQRKFTSNAESKLLLTWGRQCDISTKPAIHFRYTRTSALCGESIRLGATVKNESLVSCLRCKLELRLTA